MTSIIIHRLLVLFLLLLAGFFLARRNILNTQASKGINAILTKACLPAFAITSLQIPFAPENLMRAWDSVVGIVAMILAGTLLGCAFWLLFRKKFAKNEAGVLLCCCAFSNAIFIGKPLLEAMHGSSILFIISITSFVFNLLAFSLGVFMTTLGMPQSGGRLRAFFRAICNPIVICSIIGLLLYFFSITLPTPLRAAMDMLTACMTPLSMLLIGASLAGARPKEVLLDWRVYLISLVRLVLCPLLVLALFRPLIQDVQLLHMLFVFAAVPVATTAGILAEQYDSPYKSLASRSIVISTALCFITLPLLLSLL